MAKTNIVQLAAYGLAGYLLYRAYKDGKLNSILNPPGGGGGGGKSALLQQMIAANPNFESQMYAWQAEDRKNGGSGQNWAAFRQHQITIGAPDPGPSAPTEFGTGSSNPFSDDYRR